MTPGELAAVRGRLEEFAAEVFAPLARRDQRDKGVADVRGLLLDGRRIDAADGRTARRGSSGPAAVR
jgi:hypothetical protein